MADIQSAAQWLGRLVVEEARYLYKVESKVKELRDELDWMQCFLKEADAVQYDNAMARRWVARIREFAYEAEDTIEKFLNRVNTDTGRTSDVVLRKVKKISSFLWEARLLHQIGSDIDSLKHKISLLSSKLQTYNINLKMAESSSSWLSKLREKSYSSHVERKIIGRDNDLKSLVHQLVSDAEFKGRVFSICGVGGVGKTFLADKIFHHDEIRSQFEAFAWAYVSQPCQSSAVLQDLLSSLLSKSREQIAQMTDSELKDELCKVQRKCKCFIVIDGIWSKEVWDNLKKAFLNTSHHFKSKILITTRQDEVAKHVHLDVNIHKLQPLEDKASLLLLEEKVDGVVPLATSDQKNPDIRDQAAVAEEVRKLKLKMVECCEGLPLVICILGGLLATKKTLKEWEAVHDHITSSFIYDEHVPRWKRIIEFSYYDLPFQIKPGFLYLGYFPTNLEISTEKIIRLWEAEGLVSSGDDELSDDTLEDNAERCLGELVERSLLRVGSRGLTGKLRTCLFHDLMRELCLAKASQGNLLSIVQLGAEKDEAGQSSRSSKCPKSSKPAKKKYRRLAIYYSNKSSKKLPSDYEHAKYIRSLLFFNTLTTDEALIPLKRKLLIKAFKDYKLLRVLDIENIDVQSLPTTVGNLIHLRYLSLKGSRISKLPSTIKNLRCLQTLDLQVLSFVPVRIPDVLCYMQRLVHLYLPSKPFEVLHHKSELRLKGLYKLETLANFCMICKAEDVGSLRNLRKFSSCDFLSNGEYIKLLLGSPSSKLEHLESLSFRIDGQVLEKNKEAIGKCSKLHKLWVKGKVTQPISVGMLPQHLIQLSLNDTRFDTDPMQVLDKLPKLKKLSLKHDSYTGTTMNCSAASDNGEGGFPELSHLTLKGLSNLEDWTVEANSMLNLSYLKINRCQNLKTIPQIKSLKELRISLMRFSFFGKRSPNQEEIQNWVHSSKVEHVPFIKISHVLDLEE